jgi:hypothetical protein
MTAMRLSGWRICALVSAMLLGITWAWLDARFVLALNGDCECVRDAMRYSAWVRLVRPEDGVEVVESGSEGPRRPDGGPWPRVARPVADCFPELMEGNRLTLPPGRSWWDFVTNFESGITVIQTRKPGQHPDATWPYPFNSEAGECVYSEVLRLQSLANASVPDSYCGISWWWPLIRTWLVEGVLPALGLFAGVWFLVSRRTQVKPGA